MWSDKDLVWLLNNYPALRQTEQNCIEGRLAFQMLRLKGQYIINPEPDLIEKTQAKDYLYICDTYAVRIEWEKSASLPTVFETGGKLAAVAKKFGITDLANMHQFRETGAVCLASPVQIKRTLSENKRLDLLIENFLIPYFFAQSYFAKHKKWLWGDLSHGYWGLIEWLGRQGVYNDYETVETYKLLWSNGSGEEIAKVLRERCRGYKICRCGTGGKVRDCHPDRQLGVARIRGAIHSGIINENTFS